MNADAIAEELKELLDLFLETAPDKESNRLVWKFCNEKQRWVKAHGLHSTIRDRTVKASKSGDEIRETQYLFEEAIAKTLHNLTRSDAPFDPDSPYWVLKNALALAKALKIEPAKIAQIVT